MAKIPQHWTPERKREKIVKQAILEACELYELQVVAYQNYKKMARDAFKGKGVLQARQALNVLRQAQSVMIDKAVYALDMATLCTPKTTATAIRALSWIVHFVHPGEKKAEQITTSWNRVSPTPLTQRRKTKCQD